MDKLIKGIIDFQKDKADDYRQLFSKLALGQRPDAFFLACSDSRVAVNVFASTNPGDLFVMRNVGNIFPSADTHHHDISAQAVLEFAVHELKVKHLIVCGHSECGGMITLMNGLDKVSHEALREWLKNGEDCLKDVKTWNKRFPHLDPHNALSQLNVINQISNLQTYPYIQEKVVAGKLKVHGLWFDLKNLRVYYYFPETNQFDLISKENEISILNKVY